MGVYLPPAGIDIHYYQCSDCGLIFTDSFDHWDYKAFKKYVYNEDYIKIDPDYVQDRPANNAGVVADFIKNGKNIRLLDYGGGNGKFASLLREKGFQADSWDPMEDNQALIQPGAYDIVTSFEAFEHTPTPKLSTEEALLFLKPEGVFLFSTLTEEGSWPRPLNFWYIAPRNGHVTIYTKRSLKKLFSQYGYQLLHFSDLTHMAYKIMPPWLARS
jgi:2-polyprenyl-3-methyl-5-hydroxy-6-metoxy-1,4-benzoquinol methylase